MTVSISAGRNGAAHPASIGAVLHAETPLWLRRKPSLTVGALIDRIGAATVRERSPGSSQLTRVSYLRGEFPEIPNTVQLDSRNGLPDFGRLLGAVHERNYVC